jgi:DNA-binding response OmpR family regulator
MNERKRKILIIDDDLKHLFTAQSLLEEEGYQVITHRNGFGATNLIKDESPDLVLLDINMPGLSGERLAKVIQTNDTMQETPIFFYSSNDEDSLRLSVTRYGVTGYICKGDIAGLKRKVADYLAQTNSLLHI